MGGTTTRPRHMPALDGLRALAIGGVVAYHLGAGWARGGYLGVDLFFVLSGFLITGLLVAERDGTGSVGLGGFWSRRARRLLPALLVLLVALSVAAGAGLLTGPVDLGALRGDAIATLAYVANWHQLLAGQSYFAQFSAPSPLAHTWSLAIEEQFYVLWPLLVLGVLWLSGRRGAGAGGAGGAGAAAGAGDRRGGDGRRDLPLRVLLAGTVAGAVASATWMAWLAGHGASLDRLYYGTDTRAFDLLAGAALALATALRGRRPVQGRERVRRWWTGAAGQGLAVTSIAAVAGLAVFWWRAGGAEGPPRFMFEGGMALCAVLAVIVITAVRRTGAGGGGPVGAVLSWSPLRYVGRISYALYLWHWPVIVELSPGRTGIDGAPLQLARLAVMGLLATGSTFLVEQPFRRGALGHWPRPARRALAPAAMTATAALVLASGLVPAPAAVADTATSAVATGALSALPGVGGLGPQVPVHLLPGRVVSAQAPLRVLLVGDSVMRAQAPAVVAALQATGAAVVTDQSYPGWGLTTDRTWATDVPALLRQVRPDVVVATWSWDDQLLLAHPARYRALLERYVQTLLSPGGGVQGAAGVLFEAFPPLGPTPSYASAALRAQQESRRAGVRAWNTLVASLPAVFPGQVQFLPVDRSVELAGRFTAWLAPVATPAAPTARWVRVRSVDDTHFCPAGAARYAAALAGDLHTLVALPLPAPSWWSGAWQHDAAVYDTPAGSCPADHPPAS